MSLFIVLILLGIPLLSLLWWIWADRRLKKMNAGSAWRIVQSLAMVVLLGSFAWVVLVRANILVTPVPADLYALVLLWGLIALPAVAIPSMVGWSFWAVARHLFARPSHRDCREESSQPPGGGKWSRRRVLGTFATTLPLLATFGTAAFSLPRLSRFRIRKIELSLKDLPEALDGLRIAHVTDTHVGKFTNGKVLEAIADVTNALDADLVLLTGDLIDNSIKDLPHAVAMVQRMRARHGVFLIEGNHDLFGDPKGFEKGIRDGGIAMLRNEAATVQVRGASVQVLGIVWDRDEEAMADDVETVAALRDPAAFHILLAHHPHAFDRAAELGIPLTLAGHTHGGQLMLTEKIGAGPAMFRYWSGLYQKAGRALVVANGAGNWFPLRVHAPAEIIDLTLRKG